MRESITIVKVGGAVVENDESLMQFLESFSGLQGRKILVHGGGRKATQMATRMGIESKMVEGRRITDAPMLEVVTMVYGGLVNKHIVALLQSKGVNAIGLTGTDLNLIESNRRPLTHGIDYGYVGDVRKVNTNALTLLLDAEAVPIVAPLTHDMHGTMLNTNADTIASELARALVRHYDVTLVYCFEKKGVLANPDDEQSVIPLITRPLFEQYQKEGIISGGMIPKISNALLAVEQGVKQVLITLATDLDAQEGTKIVVNEG